MKILYIDVNYKNSSTGNIVYELHKHCKQNDIESFVCYGRGEINKEKTVYKFGLDIETYIHALLTRVTGLTGCYSYFSTKRLLKQIKKFKPDIVHIHELHAYFVNIKQLLNYLKKKDIPTVFTNHCEFLYTGKCGYAKECDKFKCNCGNCPQLKEYPKSIFFDKTKHMLNIKKNIFNEYKKITLVSPSKWLDSKIDCSFLKNKKRFIIKNGIDTSIFKFNPYVKNDDKKIVLSLGSNIFSDIKGGKQVIEISKMMKDVNFIIAGSNKYSYNLPSNVQIISWIKSQKELRDLYSRADCFLILSQYENFPTTCIESQCCGTKVVGYDVGGIKETIINGFGVVVPHNDNKSIIKALYKILDENYDKESVSKKAASFYSSDKMFKEYSKIYKELCD